MQFTFFTTFELFQTKYVSTFLQKTLRSEANGSRLNSDNVIDKSKCDNMLSIAGSHCTGRGIREEYFGTDA